MTIVEKVEFHDRIENLLKKFSFYDENLEPVEERVANTMIRH